VAIGRASSSTVIQPVGSQTATTVLTKALLGLKQIYFTSETVKSAERLYWVLRAIQNNVADAFGPLARNPMLAGNLIEGLAFTGGTPRGVTHGLGRAPTPGIICTKAVGGGWQGQIATQPAGVTTAQQLWLTNPSSGTFDLWIF
jgi:hypothetical protein